MQVWKAAVRGRPGGTLAGSLRSPESGYQRLFASTLVLTRHVHACPSGLGQRKGSSAPSSLPTVSPPELLLLHLVYFLISLSQSILRHPPSETLRVFSVQSLCSAFNAVCKWPTTHHFHLIVPISLYIPCNPAQDTLLLLSRFSRV